MLDTVTAEHFEPFIGKKGTLSNEYGSHEVVLRSVEKSKISRSKDSRESFSIEVHGDPQVQLGQSVYTFDIEGIDTLDIFFVPVAAGTYEAIFN